ncbi:MAG TPA: CsgG/HfaB family protein [Spirochaetota bacterium]|nr:CsgG/HfaB family protein [Spirochaetota bacterium]
MRFFLSVPLLLACAVTIGAKPKVAVLDFTAENTSGSYASTVRNFFESSLYDTGEFDLLERIQIDRILSARKVGSDVKGTEPASIYGKILPVEYLIVGQISRTGNYTLQARFVDAKDGSIIAISRSVAEKEKDIPRAAADLAKKINTQFSEYRRKIAENPAEPEPIVSTPFFINVRGSRFTPIKRFNLILKSATGVSAEAGYHTLPAVLSLRIGYYRFSSPVSGVQKGEMIPIMLSGGYEIPLLSNVLSITPSIALGGSVNSLTYRTTSARQGSKERKIEPIASLRTDISAQWSRLRIVSGFETGSILEEKSSLFFYAISIGASISI